jgi:transposase
VGRPGLRKVRVHSREFKLSAVRLSQQPGLQVQAVAAALDIHPFMLSKWRREVRAGVLRGTRPSLPVPLARESRRLQELERAHALLQEEHALLKKAIRFCSARNAPSSRSSTRSAARTRSRASAGSTASPAPATTPGAAARPARTRSRTGT